MKSVRKKCAQPIYTGTGNAKRVCSPTAPFYTDLGMFGNSLWNTIGSSLLHFEKHGTSIDPNKTDPITVAEREFIHQIRDHWHNCWFCARRHPKEIDSTREDLWGALTKAHRVLYVKKDGVRMCKVNGGNFNEEISYKAFIEIIKAFPDYHFTTNLGNKFIIGCLENHPDYRKLRQIHEVAASGWNHCNCQLNSWVANTIKLFSDPCWWEHWQEYFKNQNFPLDKLYKLCRKEISKRTDSEVDPSAYRKYIADRLCWSGDALLKRELKS